MEFPDTFPESRRWIAQCRRLRGNENRLANKCSHKKAMQLSLEYRQAEDFSSQKALFSLMMTDVGNEMPRHGKATKCLLNQPWSQP